MSILDDEPPLIKIIKGIALFIIGLILGLIIITPVKSANNDYRIVMTQDERILAIEQKTPEIKIEPKVEPEKLSDDELKRKYVKWACEMWGIPDKWKIVEAIWERETGKSLYKTDCSYAGACGPMQFIDSTWEKYKIDGNMDGIEDINDYEDAVQSAINYLITAGIKEDEYKAIFAYNHADWYVQQVFDIANSIEE